MKSLPYVGLDKGNGWTKVVIPGKSPIIFQSIASPASAMLDRFMNGAESDAPLNIDGTEWYAGHDIGDTTHRSAIHHGVALSGEHFALYLHALGMIGRNIDVLAMGLPPCQFEDDELKNAIKEKFTGRFAIRGKNITVGKVCIFTEPLGTARLFLQHNAADIGDANFLVIDIGHGTFDSDLVRVFVRSDGSINAGVDASKTVSEWLAVSNVCDQMSRSIKVDHPALSAVSPDRLNMRLRDGAREIKHGATTLDMETYLKPSVAEIGREIASLILDKHRNLNDIDKILLTGGGAELFKDVLAQHFHGKSVDVMSNAATANSEGFILLAQDLHAHA